MQDKTIQDNAAQYTTIQNGQYNITQDNTIQYIAAQYMIIQNGTIQHKTEQEKTRQYHARP